MSSNLSKRRSFRGWLKRVSIPNGVTGRKSEPDMPKGGVFGIPLSMSIKYAKTTIGYVDDDGNKHTKAGAIPIIVAKCGSFLKKNGLETEGIFRVSGNYKRINDLEYLFDQSSTNYGLDLNWEGYTIHDAASVLRRYLNKLPDPVIPFEFYNQFRDVMNDKTFQGNEKRIESFQSLIQNLPSPHQHLLLYLLDTLNLFASASAETKMSISNLAAVFCPGILRHPDHNTPVQYKISQYVIEFLIEFQSLFTMQLLIPMDRKKSSSGSSSNGEVPPVPFLVPSHQQQHRPPVPLRVMNPTTSSNKDSPSSNDLSFTQSPLEMSKSQDIRSSTTQLLHKATNLATPHVKQMGQKLTEFGNSIKLWVGDCSKPASFLIGTSILVTIVAVVFYEVYLAITFKSFEPVAFFISLASYCGLLYKAITTDIVQKSPDVLNNQIETVEEAEQEESNEFAVPEDPDTERAMLEDESIMSEWSGLLTRRWKPSNEDSAESFVDNCSVMSKSSRFNEEEEYDNYNEPCSSEEDEDLGFDAETLEAYLAQYDQIKKDAQLAKELQMAEQKARDVNNPFVMDIGKEKDTSRQIDGSVSSPTTDPKEEWKVRIFPRS